MPNSILSTLRVVYGGYHSSIHTFGSKFLLGATVVCRLWISDLVSVLIDFFVLGTAIVGSKKRLAASLARSHGRGAIAWDCFLCFALVLLPL